MEFARNRPGTRPFAALAAAFFFAASAQGADRVLVTEFMASNVATVADTNEEFTDWIELHNPTGSPIDLSGWHLTDDSRDLAKWPLPAVTIAPGDFLLVFASGKDLRDPAKEIHTDFQLDYKGEFLAIVAPGGIPTSFYSPKFPPQVPDVSYGLPMTFRTRQILPRGSAARYLAPTDGTLGANWTALAFDDGAWASGSLPIGFDAKDPPTYRERIRTDVAGIMSGIASSLYVRLRFSVAEGDVGRRLRLKISYEDGFVAFLNGVEVARANFTATRPSYSSRASAARPEADALEYALYPLYDRSLLVAGENVLAVQLLNLAKADLDALLDVELETMDVESIDEEHPGYFLAPTPGFPNAESALPAVAPEPDPTVDSGAFADATFVEIPAPSPETQIRYTLDGLEPTERSALYTGPIEIAQTTVLKAKAYRPGYVPSATANRLYLKVHPTLLSFTSNIPIVFVVTKGTTIGSNCGEGPYYPGYFVAFAPGTDGRARLTDPPHVAEQAAFRKRGSSTCGFAKFAFNIEFKESFDPDKRWSQSQRHDPLGRAKDVKIFDFPADSDWVMHGGNNFDRSMLRNPIAYWMSLQVGQWAARSRFVECYMVNTSAPAAAASTHYFGVYAFMEKNKQHPERIDVESLGPANNSEPEIRGGYILRRDRVGSGEVSTSAGGYGGLVYVHPKFPSTTQNQWFTAHLNKVIQSLNPNIGSQEDTDLIDVQGWIDHHILCWYPKNVDAFRLSGYFFKPRYGPMVMGPVWDYDRTMGCSDDGRASDPTGWNNSASGDGGTQYFAAGGMGSWYSFLFQSQPPTGDSPWAKAYRARWRELRRGPLRTENILGQIDAWANELKVEAADRNYKRWPQWPPRGGFAGEVNLLKNWLSQRAAWIDSQFIEPPAISPPGGLVAAGTKVTLSSPDGSVYYTVDGTDPKTTSGGVASGAVLYAAPVTVSDKVKIRARVRIGTTTTWSNLAEAVFYTSVPALAVTEIMYNGGARPGDTYSVSAYDFIELHNFGAAPVDLRGMSFVRPRFDFANSAIQTLGPGEHLVLGYNLAGLRERYGDLPNLAGQFGSSLSDTRLTIELVGSLGEPVLQAKYEDSWYPETDGQGYSLVLVDPKSDPATWITKEAWKPSAEIGGSPGRADGPVVVPNQMPGDVSQDAILNITDAVGILDFLFRGTKEPCETVEANRTLMDVDGDAHLNVTDAIALLNYLFLGGRAPALGEACVFIPGCPQVCPP